ncbi:hypothetical protein ACLMJK_007154 [Lecanora helva]
MSPGRGTLTTLFFNFAQAALFLFCSYAPFVLAGIGSSSLSQTDTTDPQKANPRYNITCLGEYERPLPSYTGFSPIYPQGIPMQKLCAKTQFSGGSPGEHIGGWCQATRFSSEVVFDIGVGAQVDLAIANPRVMLACSYRCFCNFGLPPNAPQPRYGDYAQTWRSDQTYELQLDVTDDYDVPWSENFEELSTNSLLDIPQVSHKGTAGKAPVTVAEVKTESQQAFALDSSGSGEHFTFVSMDAENNIDCHGTLPKFPLPSPYSTSDFSTLGELCAVQFSGGKREANAGGYCHRSDNPDGSFSRTVWFSDEFTPRLEWTWGGNNFFAAAAIRFHCWQRCACTKDPSKKDPATSMFLNPIWNIVSSQNIAQHGDGSLTLEATGSQKSEVQILPPQPSSNSLSAKAPAGTCGPDGQQFCPTPWPTDTLGPILQMESPPNATLIIKESSSTKFTKCGQFCDTPQDCGPSDSTDSCVCALPSPKDARTLGLDPVFPKTVCLALALAITGISGRDVPQYLDERGSPYQCACNSTHISNECCSRSNGQL